jgi:LDH2 family malate/lactate/ureidoglycolate dehydrogenase
MNRPPDQFTPLLPEPLREFIAAVFRHEGMPEERAALLAGLLTTNDLRGVFSHGTRQTTAYVRHFRQKELTPAPEVTVVAEAPTSIQLDGGGGLGYFPCYEAAHRLTEKAKAHGIAMALTRNHGHFGAAGIYSRIALAQDLFGYVTSGHQLHLTPGETVLNAAGGSPMSFALPTNEEPPFVLDFGAMHDLYAGSTHVEEIIRLAPSTVFRSLGLGAVCQSLGGFLAGVPSDPSRANREWPGANQGSFMIAVDLSVFLPVEQFKAEMDDYSRRIRAMKPLEGFNRAELPGQPEAEREQRYAVEGIPISNNHAAALRQLATECGLEAPV